MAVLNRRQRGMTLIELLVAMAILAVVMLSIIGLFTQSISMNISGQNYMSANNMARQRLEELIALPYQTLRGQVTAQEGTWFHEDIGPYTVGLGTPWSRDVHLRELRLQKTGDATAQMTTLTNPGMGNLIEITVRVSPVSVLGMGWHGLEVVAYKVDGLRY